MPRFSDIFVYEDRYFQGNVIIYKNCYLLKQLDKLDKNERVESIIFDVDGVLLMVQSKGDLVGPYCLTF